MSKILFLSEKDLYSLGADSPINYLPAIEDAFKHHGSGKYIQPLKLYMRWNENKNRLNLMPATLPLDPYNLVGVKIVTSVPSNPCLHDLPRGESLLLISSSETGLPRAFLAGRKISAMRTASITTVAAKYLAKQDSQRLGLIGAGPISANHVLCLKAAFPQLSEVSVYDPDHSRVEKFQKMVSRKLDIKVNIKPTYQEAIISKDIVIVATNINTPFIEGRYLSPGTFFGNVGIMEPEVSVIAHSNHIIVDDIEQCTQKDCPLTRAINQSIVKRNNIKELGKIINSKTHFKRAPDDIVFFNSIGMGMCDLVCAFHFIEKAFLQGKGQFLELDNGEYDEFGLYNVQSLAGIR